MTCWILQKLRSFKGRFAADVLGCLSEQAVREALGGSVKRLRHWDSWTLLRTFLCQLAGGEPCREAVERAIQQQWLPPGASPNTSAYCQGRARMAETPLIGLVQQSGQALAGLYGGSPHWRGRAVKVADGTTLRLAETPANQALYPQPSGQRAGCGFPLMYLCALLSLGCGAVLKAVVASQSEGERPLMRRLWEGLDPGDILLADRGFGSYAEIACLRRRGVDVLVRTSRRSARRGRLSRLGPGHWLVQWERPRNPGAWIDRSELPQRMVVRVVQLRVEAGGFRTRHLLLATTLTDAERWPARQLAALYRRRWQMELRLRDIKTTLGLEQLRCKSPAACRKELWVGLLAYNLIRTVMADAARQGGLKIEQISFAGALQRLGQLGSGPLARRSPRGAYQELLRRLAADHVPRRPGRREPRAVKGRPKNYQLLTGPRQTFQECPHRNRYRKPLT